MEADRGTVEVELALGILALRWWCGAVQCGAARCVWVFLAPYSIIHRPTYLGELLGQPRLHRAATEPAHDRGGAVGRPQAVVLLDPRRGLGRRRRRLRRHPPSSLPGHSERSCCSPPSTRFGRGRHAAAAQPVGAQLIVSHHNHHQSRHGPRPPSHGHGEVGRPKAKTANDTTVMYSVTGKNT